MKTIEQIEYRIKLLESRNKKNGKIVAKLQRELRNRKQQENS